MTFVTGPTEPGQNINGYVLTKLEFRAAIVNQLTVSVWTDSNGSPRQQTGRTDTHVVSVGDGSARLQDVSADGLDAFLLPETKYWIRFEICGADEAGTSQRSPHNKLTTHDEDSDSLDGWSIESGAHQSLGPAERFRG